MITNNTIEKHRNKIIKQLYERCGDYQLCLDVFQDACLNACNSENVYTGGGLFIIAKNVLIDTSRKMKLRKKINVKVDCELQVPYEDNSEKISSLIEFEDKLDLVKKEIDTLSPKKKLVVMERLNGKSFNQISEEYNMKLNTILPYYHHGIKQIKEKIHGNAN